MSQPIRHNIPIGTLVETEEGIRLYVMKHTLDCDGTPLYALGLTNGANLDVIALYGQAEDSLKVIRHI